MKHGDGSSLGVLEEAKHLEKEPDREAHGVKWLRL